MNFISEFYNKGLLLTWERDRPEGWELASGSWSPFYFMFRHALSYPDLFQHSVSTLTDLTNEIKKTINIDMLVGVASTGIPLAAGVSLRTSLPLAYTRKVSGVRNLEELSSNSKAWGQHSLVEGVFKEKTNYLIIDDVITGGASKELAMQQVELEAKRQNCSAQCVGILVVVDRGYPNSFDLPVQIKSGYRLYNEIDQISSAGGTKKEIDVIKHYMEKPEDFHNESLRNSILGA